MDINNIEVPATLKETLQKSIELEEQGYQYYTDAAEKVTNSLGKRTLERLANDERIHIKRFTELYNAVSDNTIDKVNIEDTQPTTFDEIFNRLKDQLDDAIEDMSEKGVDDEEVIEMALDLENTTRFFYENAAESTNDPKIKKLYQLLANEEKAHYQILRKTIQFLEDPSLFFGMSGSH
ncbi:MAG: hypothetical protein GF313_10120 [Caldithrix sp.]|nr:hypothetical protein [Caldithrix sp.]